MSFYIFLTTLIVSNILFYNTMLSDNNSLKREYRGAGTATEVQEGTVATGIILTHTL